MTYHGYLATHKILILVPLAYNLSPTSQAPAALPGHAVVTLQGIDAAAFAHAQFANDVTSLAVGQWQWNAWLTPKGRVLAIFALLRTADDGIVLVLLDYPADEFVEQLRRFVFRRKVDIGVRDAQVLGALQAPVQASGATMARLDDGIELDYGSAAMPRTLRIVEGQATAAVDDGTWAALDLRHGLPRLSAAQRGQWTPQQLSLDRLPAYSVKKGCYPGQEIVARTHFLGKAKRALALLEADSAVTEGDAVGTGDTALGEIICVRPQANRWLALAVLPLQRETAELQAAGVALRESALLEGLQRS